MGEQSSARREVVRRALNSLSLRGRCPSLVARGFVMVAEGSFVT